MSEKPILFSAQMVRAILSGQKSQTRRAVKSLLGFGQITEFQRSDSPGYDWTLRNRKLLWNDLKQDRAIACCPYGQVGGRLWVRETWQGPLFDYDLHMDAYLANPSAYKKTQYCEYAADGGPTPEFFSADDELVCRWTPSIHMPRWASRITLEITDVRVERLQSISEADAMAEGVRNSLHLPGGRFARENFQHLWWTINGEGSWEANPWVWAVTFKRVEQVS